MCQPIRSGQVITQNWNKKRVVQHFQKEWRPQARQRVLPPGMQKCTDNASFDSGQKKGTAQVKINRIREYKIGKSQPEGPAVPVGNEARRVSEGWGFPFKTEQ